jgi:hypothetical protein
MKFLALSMLFFGLSGFVRADVLRLRNGTEFVGHYIGGTNTQIWFQRDGMVSTTEVIPTSLVEALKFEPSGANSAATQVSPAKSWMDYFRTVLATAWFPYSSSTRTAMVTSPGGRLGRATR